MCSTDHDKQKCEQQEALARAQSQRTSYLDLPSQQRSLIRHRMITRSQARAAASASQQQQSQQQVTLQQASVTVTVTANSRPAAPELSLTCSRMFGSRGVPEIVYHPPKSPGLREYISGPEFLKGLIDMRVTDPEQLANMKGLKIWCNYAPSWELGELIRDVRLPSLEWLDLGGVRISGSALEDFMVAHPDVELDARSATDSDRAKGRDDSDREDSDSDSSSSSDDDDSDDKAAETMPDGQHKAEASDFRGNAQSPGRIDSHSPILLRGGTKIKTDNVHSLLKSVEKA